MRTPRSSRTSLRRWRLLLVPAIGLAVIGQLTLAGPAGAASAATAARSVELGTGSTGGVNGDQPSVRFISTAPGSGNTMSYQVKIPVDPQLAPTATGSVTNYGQLASDVWFGLPVCDPKSYPQNPCTADSDANSSEVSNPADAGSAFMKLQLFPPGFAPLIDGESCSATKWCAALTITSLECTFGRATCNFNCENPENFALLQTNGVPAGPPSPQLTDVSTFLANADTLLMNPGDVLKISITDPAAGLTTTIQDLTTDQMGTMTAGAAYGFMNTNIGDCSGTPFTYHAEYSTASIHNQVPWADLEGGVLMGQDIGHSEVCSSVTNNDPFAVSYPGGQSYADNNTYDTCTGGSEGTSATGEGPCDSATGVCQNSTTQGHDGPVACPTDNYFTGQLCEFADGFCFKQGDRTVVINGVDTTATSDANQCFTDRYQNGDLDFDGLSYQRSAWPNGSSNHPTSFEYIGPFQANGRPYPQVQFETDVGSSEFLCNKATGAGCTAPPAGANFYPYWSLSLQRFPLGSLATSCVWNFGGSPSSGFFPIPGIFEKFGGDAQYGRPDVARFAGTLISRVMPNPQFGFNCAGLFD